MYDLAIFALGRDLSERMVPVWYYLEKFAVIVYANSWILFRVRVRDFQGAIGTAVVYDGMFPIRICLGQYAFDALGYVLLAIVYGSHYTDERLMRI